MALENKRPFIPELPPKKEVSVNPEKSAKKLYSDATFTISKLTERADRSIREIDGLTSLRQERERIHSHGDITSGENAKLQAETDNIKNKLNKSRDELVAATEAYSKLDQDLSDLGVVADNPMRLTTAQNRDFWAKTLARIEARITIEANITEHSARQAAVREALRGVKPQQKPKPFTETIVHPGNNTTVAELNKYEDAFRRASELDNAGVITPEQVPHLIAKADEEDALLAEKAADAERMSHVAPVRTQEEIDARNNSPMGGKETLTPTRKQSAFTLRSPIDPSKDQYAFSPATAKEFIAKQAKEALIESQREEADIIDFNKSGLDFDNIREAIASDTIQNFDQLDAEIKNLGLSNAIKELLPASEKRKGTSELFGKKIIGLFGKPWFDKKTAQNHFLDLASKAFDKASQTVDSRPVSNDKKIITAKRELTLSGEKITTKLHTNEPFTYHPDTINEGAQRAKEDEGWAQDIAKSQLATKESFEVEKKKGAERAKAIEIQREVDSYIDNETPVFIKRSSGEMDSNGRVKLLTDDGRALVVWKDPKTGEDARKYIKTTDLVMWQKEGAQAPKTKNIESPRAMHEAAGEYLNSVQQQLRSGHISTAVELENALNQMESPSYQDLLSPQERYTTKISEAVSDKVRGLFTTKYKFNPNLAAEFVAKLTLNAAKKAETFRE